MLRKESVTVTGGSSSRGECQMENKIEIRKKLYISQKMGCNGNQCFQLTGKNFRWKRKEEKLTKAFSTFSCGIKM